MSAGDTRGCDASGIVPGGGGDGGEVVVGVAALEGKARPARSALSADGSVSCVRSAKQDQVMLHTISFQSRILRYS